MIHGTRLLAATLLWLTASAPLVAQCILSPDSPGQNGQTRRENFLTLVDHLYATDFEPTHRIAVNGKNLQVPPWYNSSTECGTANLKSGSGAINPPLASPSRTNYLVVSDELSELAVVAALAADDARMMEIHNTVEAMESSVHSGLPCWIAEVSGNSLNCRSQDTASDATARFGLAYYQAANNPLFPPASRALYRAAGDALAADHLQHEYAYGCHTSPVTGRQICHWAAGGGNTADSGVGGLEMWIGYHQDIARFLLAAYESTGTLGYAQRAEDVVDQWLIASTFDGVNLTFGRFNFGWNTGVQPIAPRPGNPYWWDNGRAWDTADAPRALWLGDVLRAVQLSSGGAPLTGAYAKLSQWVQLLLANGTQTATTSCVEYNQNGSAVAGNCGTDYYYNGLGAGLHTHHATTTLDDKLDTALSQFGWASGHTWNSASCFGIYRGIRPVKALASAIGLDAATYGGAACSGTISHNLVVTKAGSGSGTVTSSPAGISCGGDCAESYAAGSNVTLTAQAATGSTFAGWSGDCSGTGTCQVTLNADRAVTATFSGSAPTAPTWLRFDATQTTRTQLKLLWQDNSNNETGFKVERKQGCCGPWTLLPDAGANQSGTATFTNTGLACGTTYAYRVWAFNSAGISAKTNEAGQTTSSCP